MQWNTVGGDSIPDVSITPVTFLHDLLGERVSATSHMSFQLSLTSGALSLRYEYRVTKADSRGTLPVLASTWSAIPNGRSALQFNLTDGLYALDARVVGGTKATSLTFFVHSSLPRARVKGTEEDSTAESVKVTLALEPHLESNTSVLNTGVQAVHYSLDAGPFLTVNGSSVALTGLAAGPHSLLLKAENAVGSVEGRSQKVSWVTTQGRAMEAACLEITPRATASSGYVSFDVSGSCSDHYKWRVDGSAWVEAVHVQHHEFAVSDTDSATHYWEALPLTNGDLWTRPPLVHSWSKAASGPTGATKGMAVNVGTFQDGPHTLTVKAIDAAGKH
jgi:hypothetical protein